MIYDTISTGKAVVIMFLESISFEVEGMKCNHCASNVKEGLKKIENVKKVNVNLEKKEVSVFFKKNKEVSIEDIKKTIEDLGYTYKGTI